MALPRLELISAHGDQTLPSVRFVVYEASSEADQQAVAQSGLRFVEGRTVVSINVIQAGPATTGSTRRLLVWTVPAAFRVGYGVFTTAYIDRPLKRVSGAPLRYAAGRRQLAFYLSDDVDAARLHIEAEAANGYGIDQHPQFVVDPKFLIGVFAGQNFDYLTRRLGVSIQSMEAVDFAQMEASLREVFQPAMPAHAVLAPTVVRDLIIATIESAVMSQMRMMRWSGLAALGYSFFEQGRPVQLAVRGDVNRQRAEIDELGRRLASSQLFNAELAWLKLYVSRQLELMRVELDGAELEAAQDR